MRTRADVTQWIKLPDGSVEVDEAGYLVDPSQWSADFARKVAQDEGLSPNPLHWRVLAFMRSYLDQHGIAADARFAIRFLAVELGLDKHDAKHKLFELFPEGYVKQACKMAGMRQPRAWSTG
ncbi:TusE/DsrC/DsvC family sulfur relay protein [Sinisalibacter lacisalsi]|uniref:Sulfite reductase, dissimilatory-type subunit gamma n=1 Tax=Sinisalibacter lacisalsi TaxID=1526570 RepID=A0ABQ1QJY2_9RHOB|nr:TusE/DsrC/DsvC family sulfur relay protein [Sinisalibacter lacisalsi]GGD28426.1 sulfite reductase, dissimilatory-type subunit gamma [Sinisalibacter lacisalsi]